MISPSAIQTLYFMLPFFIVMPATVYSIISLVCAVFFLNKVPSKILRQSLSYDVTIIKPVKGMDSDSYDNFASFLSQEYSDKMQIIFAAASSDDPIIPVIQQLIDDFSHHDITLIVNPAQHGPNQKVSNLINAYASAKYEIIIVSDSDISVEPDYLSSVVSHFAIKEIGLVTSLYRTSDVHGIATAIEATGFTAEMIPNVLVARKLEGLTFALGASMAVRREALNSIGGFQTLSKYLADDYQLGNQIHLAGWKIELDSCFVESVIKPENIMTVLSRQLRWGRTMRVSRPGGYLASVITLPFPAVLLATIFAQSISDGLLAIALLYIVRSSVTLKFSRTYVKDNLFPRWLWLLPIRDMLAFFVWALALMGNRVEWRGNRFILKPGGKIEEII